MGYQGVGLGGTFDDKGVTNTAGVVVAVALVTVVGFFTSGTSAKIPSGSGARGLLDEDIAFRAVAAQPQVLEVPVAASAQPAAVAASSSRP